MVLVDMVLNVNLLMETPKWYSKSQRTTNINQNFANSSMRDSSVPTAKDVYSSMKIEVSMKLQITSMYTKFKA